MAERRMFSKTIMGSDTFTDMPASTQILYVHLSLQADDDGFLGNPKKIQKMTGCTIDDFNGLVDENFIIPFKSGVIAITHWKVHNRVRSDRYKETIYLKEKAQLRETATGVYELIPEEENGIPSDNHMDTNGIPSDNQTDTNGIPSGNQTDTNGIPSDNQTVSERYTQYSIGKDSVGKDSIGEYSEGDEASPAEPPKHTKPVRHKYGEYQNVLLSDEDYDKLVAEFPNDYEERIERLSFYIKSSGKSYKDHLATIRAWARKEADKPQNNPTKGSSNPFLDMI